MVLVVDDDLDTRDSLVTYLGAEGYDAQAARDGQDALEQLGAGLRPHAILLDLMMPRVNGFEFLTRMRASLKFGDIPVVILSANRGYGASDLGVFDVLRKPASYQEILSAVQRAAA